MPPGRLRLTQAQYEQLVAHMRQGLTLPDPDKRGEVCGLLAGRDGVVTRVIPCANVSPTPMTNYRVADRDLLHVPRLEDEGLELVAIYHSHPVTVPYPSPTDVAEVRYPDALYVLLSLRRGLDQPELKAYAIEKGIVREIAHEIT